MAGHKTGNLAAQRSARRCNHIGLGTAGIGDHRARPEIGLDGRRIAPVCATGAAISTRSAPSTASAGDVV
jgi:hypothetical protein